MSRSREACHNQQPISTKDLTKQHKGSPCLWGVAATCEILQEEKKKKNFGTVSDVCTAPGLGPIRTKRKVLINLLGRMGQNQAIPLHNPNVALQTTITLNPATLLPAVNSDSS